MIIALVIIALVTLALKATGPRTPLAEIYRPR